MKVKSIITNSIYLSYNDTGLLRRSNEYSFPVNPRDKAVYIANVEAALDQNNLEEFKFFLRKEIILPPRIKRYTQTASHSDFSTSNINIYTYESYWCTNSLETLLGSKPWLFIDLYKKSADKPEFQKALLDFNGLELDALVGEKPLGKLLINLAKFKHYAYQLENAPDGLGKYKSKIVLEHANALFQQVLAAEGLDESFKQKFTAMLHREDPLYNHPRFNNLKQILANMAFCVMGLGVFYAAALVIHRKQTGRIFFFDRTQTQENVDNVEESLNNLEV